MIDFDSLDPDERSEDLIHRLSVFVENYVHRKDMGITHDSETTEGDEELNKARPQQSVICLINMFMYIYNLELIIVKMKCKICSVFPPFR